MEFGKDSISKKNTGWKDIECRYRYPQRAKRSTIIQNASESLVPWYDWDGTKEERFIKEVCPKRGVSYYGFQNVCCPAVSYSKTNM